MSNKTELRVVPHSVLRGEQVIELWWNGMMIGTVTGRDGPGIRVISKYPMEVINEQPPGQITPVNLIEVKIGQI